jgi:carboxypeptidase-like protein/TonB-dependent receptor-like protein
VQATFVLRLAPFVFALFAAAAQLTAQPTATLTGRVASTDGNPLPQAQVSVRGTPLATVAALDGGFRIHAVPSRSQTLHVRMLGYQPRMLVIEMVPGETLHVEIILTPNPLPLDTVEVSSDVVVSPAMRGFNERRAHGPGVFFTREDIVRMQARVFTDVLRRAAGVQIRPVRGGLANNVSVQTRGSECSVLFFMNGTAFPIPADQPIDHFVAPEEVVGVEVYSGSSEIPAQFNSSRFNSRCGVVVIWTRIGPERRRRP